MNGQTNYEIQQDNANYYRVIRTGVDGIRRAVDHPPCRTRTEARQRLAEMRRDDRYVPLEDNRSYRVALAHSAAASTQSPAIGVLGDGRLSPDPSCVPGRCDCGGQTWPLDDGGWQCQDCGKTY